MCPRPEDKNEVQLEMIMESLQEVKESLEEIQAERTGNVPGKHSRKQNKRDNMLQQIKAGEIQIYSEVNTTQFKIDHLAVLSCTHLLHVILKI